MCVASEPVASFVTTAVVGTDATAAAAALISIGFAGSMGSPCANPVCVPRLHVSAAASSARMPNPMFRLFTALTPLCDECLIGFETGVDGRKQFVPRTRMGAL
jgi:hypothetical protein